jgi:hypothetical protein
MAQSQIDRASIFEPQTQAKIDGIQKEEDGDRK